VTGGAKMKKGKGQQASFICAQARCGVTGIQQLGVAEVLHMLIVVACNAAMCCIGVQQSGSGQCR
jgi:hypothetical protein